MNKIEFDDDANMRIRELERELAAAIARAEVVAAAVRRFLATGDPATTTEEYADAYYALERAVGEVEG
jgi:hypothetical protein